MYVAEYSAWVESEYFLNRAIEWCTSSRNRHSLSAIAQYIYCNDRLDGEIVRNSMMMKVLLMNLGIG